MHVYKQRSLIERNLERSVGQSSIVVKSPDHPLLIRGPDLIVGGRDGILAIICPTVEEEKDTSLARARFALSRAALPPHARFVLVTQRQDSQVATALSNDFTAILTMRNMQKLSDLAISPQQLYDQPFSEKLQHKIKDRFGSAYRLSKYYLRNEEKYLVAKNKTRRRLELHQIVSSSSVRLSSTEGDVNAASISKLALSEANLTYVLDSGVPHLRDAAPSALFLDGIPEVRGDPEKYVRAAALSGVVVAPTAFIPRYQEVAISLERWMSV